MWFNFLLHLSPAKQFKQTTNLPVLDRGRARVVYVPCTILLIYQISEKANEKNEDIYFFFLTSMVCVV